MNLLLALMCFTLALTNTFTAIALWRHRGWARRVSAAIWIFYGIILILSSPNYVLLRESATSFLLGLICFAIAVRLLSARTATLLAARSKTTVGAT